VHKPATTKDELAAILPTTNWYSRLPSSVVTDLLNTIQYVTGKLAHMEYYDIHALLNEDEFLEFLIIAGTDEEKFGRFKARYCTGDAAAKYCADGRAYCDDSVCKGHMQ
jgi:hypothetical protein